MIDQIAKTVEEVARRLEPATVAPQLVADPSGKGQLALVRDGYTLKPIVGPTKMKRGHVFHDLESFAAWLSRHAGSSTKTGHDIVTELVEVLVTMTQAQAALEPADPTGDFVTCVLTDHPSFAAWKGIFDKPLDQKTLHRFVRGNISAFDVGMPGDVFAGQLQLLNVTAGKDINAELDTKGFYKFTSSTGRAELQGNIASRFTINIPIFAGVRVPVTKSEILYPLDVLLSMDVDTDKGVITFVLSCPSLALALYQARLDAVAWLKSLLDEGFLVGLGELKLQESPKLTEK